MSYLPDRYLEYSAICSGSTMKRKVNNTGYILIRETDANRSGKHHKNLLKKPEVFLVWKREDQGEVVL